MSRCCSASQSSHGLTLMELVVVLGILAVLSSMAVRSLQPIADQARYDATVRLLSDMRSAIVGSGSVRTSAGAIALDGYIADLGQLPSEATDLVTRPVGVLDRTLQEFDSDRDSINDVSLSSGWQGPYVQVGVGQTSVLDGWGRSLTFISAGGGLQLLSLGSDGDSLANEDGYRADLMVNILLNQIAGDVVCRLFEIDTLSGLRIDPAPTGSQELGVLFYGVNAAGGTNGAVEELLLPVVASGSFEVRRADTLQGMVAMRAILWDDLDNDGQFDSGEPIVKKSYVHYLQVNSAIDNRVELDLR